MDIASEKLSEVKENVQYSETRMTIATIKQSTKEFDPEVIRRIVMRHMSSLDWLAIYLPQFRDSKNRITSDLYRPGYTWFKFQSDSQNRRIKGLCKTEKIDTHWKSDHIFVY